MNSQSMTMDMANPQTIRENLSFPFTKPLYPSNRLRICHIHCHRLRIHRGDHPLQMALSREKVMKSICVWPRLLNLKCIPIQKSKIKSMESTIGSTELVVPRTRNIG